tara:strand:- start:5132 stop:6400 length:1269 start_codon:yes stop_codon:yes gene_type:complete
MSFNKIDELRKKYNEILDIVINNTEENEKLKKFKESYSNDDLENIISKFCKDLESENKYFKLFISRNARLFGTKLSLKIIPSYSIKALLSKNDYLWECVQLIYAIYRTNDNKYKKNVDNIIQSIEKFNLGGKKNEESDEKNEDLANSADGMPEMIKNLMSDSSSGGMPDMINNLMNNASSGGMPEMMNNLMKDTPSGEMPDFNSLLKSANLLNEETNNDDISEEDKKAKKNDADNLIMDIAGTLRDNIVNASKSDGKINPMENMIETSKMISEKYSEKIQSGSFSMNDMFESLGRMMNDIDEKTSQDEELQNIELDDKINPNDIMKDLGINTNDFNPLDMISSLLNKKKENKELTPEQIKEMEEFYASINTEDLVFDSNKEKPENENLLSKLNETLLSTIPDDKKQELEKISESLNASANNA